MLRFLGVTLAIALLASVARAQCPAMEGASDELAERTPEERAAFILERTRSVEEAARTWSATFALGYMGLAVAQMGVLTASTDRGQRADMAVGAISSMIGVLSIFLLPQRVLNDRAEIERLAVLASHGDCDALAQAERLFAHDAAGEEFGTSWLMHVGSMLFNIAIGVFQGLAFGRWMSGGISAAIGIAVGELQLLTKPTGLIAALERYRTGAFRAPDVTLMPSFGEDYGGFAIGTSFG